MRRIETNTFLTMFMLSLAAYWTIESGYVWLGGGLFVFAAAAGAIDFFWGPR